MSNRNLGLILKDMGMINDKDIEEGLQLQKKEKIRLGEALVKLGKISKAELDYVISKQIDLPFVIVSKDQVDFELVKRFSIEFMKSHKALPIYADEYNISVITDDPFDTKVVEYFERVSNKKVLLSVASEENILDILNMVEGKADSEFDRLKDLILENGIRYDFFIISDRLMVYNFLNDCRNKVFDDLFYLGMKEVREYLKERYSFFYEEITGCNGVYMQLYPVELEDGIYFSNMDYIGKVKVFKRYAPVEGYPFVSNIKIDYKDLILIS
ncbi:MAG: hypothetical protein ACP5LO_03595 [Calditerrivibrio sp.]|uniref:GspE/PulE/PilB domain-containing protein n=1 Tax=Calditerrivibrio sp. TaxID=2792612 RepID=UPI003D0D7A6F